MIKFGCSSCGKRIGVPETAAGRRVRCPKCADPTRVPDAPPAPKVEAEPAGGGLADLASLEADGPLELNEVETPAPAAGAAPPEAPTVAAAAPPPPVGDTKDCPKCGAPAAASAKICVSCGHGFKGLSAAGRAKTRKAGVFAGRTGVAILGGLGTALACGFVWAMVVKLTGYEIGYLAIGLGAGTGIVTALIAQQQSWLVGLGAVFTALLGWFAGKVMIAWLVVMPMLGSLGMDLDFSNRDAYILSRIEEVQAVDPKIYDAAWGYEEASEEDFAAWQRMRDEWIASHGDPGENPFVPGVPGGGPAAGDRPDRRRNPRGLGGGRAGRRRSGSGSARWSSRTSA